MRSCSAIAIVARYARPLTIISLEPARGQFFFYDCYYLHSHLNFCIDVYGPEVLSLEALSNTGLGKDLWILVWISFWTRNWDSWVKFSSLGLVVNSRIWVFFNGKFCVSKIKSEKLFYFQLLSLKFRNYNSYTTSYKELIFGFTDWRTWARIEYINVFSYLIRGTLILKCVRKKRFGLILD